MWHPFYFQALNSFFVSARKPLNAAKRFFRLVVCKLMLRWHLHSYSYLLRLLGWASNGIGLSTSSFLLLNVGSKVFLNVYNDLFSTDAVQVSILRIWFDPVPFNLPAGWMSLKYVTLSCYLMTAPLNSYQSSLIKKKSNLGLAGE